MINVKTYFSSRIITAYEPNSFGQGKYSQLLQQFMIQLMIFYGIYIKNIM